jgi:hypothetical protein
VLIQLIRPPARIKHTLSHANGACITFGRLPCLPVVITVFNLIAALQGGLCPNLLPTERAQLHHV